MSDDAPWAGNPWAIYSPSGFATACADRSDWLAEWRRRVRALESGGEVSSQVRRDRLERFLKANAPVFRAIIEHGAVSVVLDATALVLAANVRLSSGAE